MNVSSGGWEHFDVEADVGVRAWGSTLAEAFAYAALGVFALIVAPEEVTARERREVRAQGHPPEALLVNWLNECLYIHEIEGFVVHRVEPTAWRDGIVHGVLHGERFQAGRHRSGTVVKAVTSHGVTLARRDGRHEVSVIIDV